MYQADDPALAASDMHAQSGRDPCRVGSCTRLRGLQQCDAQREAAQHSEQKEVCSHFRYTPKCCSCCVSQVSTGHPYCARSMAACKQPHMAAHPPNMSWLRAAAGGCAQPQLAAATTAAAVAAAVVTPTNAAQHTGLGTAPWRRQITPLLQGPSGARLLYTLPLTHTSSGVGCCPGSCASPQLAEQLPQEARLNARA